MWWVAFHCHQSPEQLHCRAGHCSILGSDQPDLILFSFLQNNFIFFSNITHLFLFTLYLSIHLLKNSSLFSIFSSPTLLLFGNLCNTTVLPAVFFQEEREVINILSYCHFHRNKHCPLVMVDHVFAYELTSSMSSYGYLRIPTSF